MKSILIYVSSWIGLVVLAILNAAVRQKGYGHFISELSAHQISTFIFVILIGVYTYFISGVFALHSSRQALLVGGIWLIMTICFEFIFGHYFLGHSWNRLLADYNLFKGRLWGLYLTAVMFVPLLIDKLIIRNNF